MPGPSESRPACRAPFSLGPSGGQVELDSGAAMLGRGRTTRRRAFVTLLSQESYLPGVQALARSLRLWGSSHPLVVMHTPNIAPSALKELAEEGCSVRLAERFHPTGVDSTAYVRAVYAECWNKLRMWEWEEFERLVYLDADTILRRNIDHLFEELPPDVPLWAVGDCYGGREEAEERDRCCHFRPTATPEYFNAGVYVMTPNRKELAGMEAALAAGSVAVGRFAEQDFLNGYFAGRWRHLPYVYNAQKRIKYHHPDLWCLDDIAVIHFVDDKPWSHPYSPENQLYSDIVQFWWEVYEGRLSAARRSQSCSNPALPGDINMAPAEASPARVHA